MGGWAWCWRPGGLAAATVLASGAGAAGKSGPIQIYVSGTTVTTPILVTGVVTDYGKATSVTKAGKPDENGNYEKIVLQKGGFWVDATALNKKLNGVEADDRQDELLLRLQGLGPDEAVQGHRCLCGHQRHGQRDRELRRDRAEAPERQVQHEQQSARPGRAVRQRHRLGDGELLSR